MTTVSFSHPIPVAVTEVWPALAAYEAVDRYHPLVERVSMSSEEARGLGACRTCHMYDGTSVDERVVDWQDGHGFKVELSNFSMPLKSAVAEMKVRSTGERASEGSIAMEFVVKGGPLGGVMGQLVMKPMMRRMFGQVLRSLEHHVVTGDLIGKDGRTTPRDELSSVA